jgi:hypothetical protein
MISIANSEAECCRASIVQRRRANRNSPLRITGYDMRRHRENPPAVLSIRQALVDDVRVLWTMPLWVPFCPGPRGALDRGANTAKGAGAVGAVSAGVRRLTSRTGRARGPGVALEWARGAPCAFQNGSRGDGNESKAIDETGLAVCFDQVRSGLRDGDGCDEGRGGNRREHLKMKVRRNIVAV